MTHIKQALAPDFSEGVDRKLLKKVRDRFLLVNKERLQRCQQSMSMRHRDIIEVLPLLYHVNHPLLPGYVSQDAPKGVSSYEPEKGVISLAKAFTQSFRYRQDRRAQPAVHSIFMMGSTGTLAHSESSDVDLWLCHEPDLSESERQLLKQKADLLDGWANDQGLELHTFLMDAEAFKKGGAAPAMDSESSGSAQHVLLLDEFYRTAILLAGRYPLWWLVPPSMEEQYNQITERLIGQRFLKANEVIDFGSVAEIPKSEMLGAGLWQLYKSIDAPYKSVLKLLLAEVYAQELPGKPCLSQVFKQAIYDDERDVGQLDPYLLIYKRLEKYLLDRNEIKRLELVRKSFYLKVNRKLSKKVGLKGAGAWQRELLENLSSDWMWRPKDFKRLDERFSWKVDQVIQERQQLFSELTNSYRFLSDYARLNQVGSSMTVEDLSLLGRKLNATFQRKAGKVEKVNPGIAANIWEERLAIHHSSSQEFQAEQNSWLLYRDLSSPEDAAFMPSLRKSTHLIELIAWLYFNGIADTNTRLSLIPGSSGVTLFELRKLLEAMEKSFETPFKPVPQRAFLEAANVTTLALFINVGIDPMANLTERGLLKLSDRTDSLGYSSQRHNLVKTIDQVAFNSWNEMSARRYEMGETLMQNLQAYLLMCSEQSRSAECDLHVFCFTSQRADAIATRVKTLFLDAKQTFFTGVGVETARYVLEVEERFYVIDSVAHQFRYSAFADVESVLVHLAKTQKQYSQVAMDRYAFVQDPFLKKSLRLSRPESIQVFYLVVEDAIEVVVIDEFGSFLRSRFPLVDPHVFQSQLHCFLQTTLERRQLDHALAGSADMPDVEWYRGVEVKENGKVQIKFNQVRVELSRSPYSYSSTAYYDGLALRFDLMFDGREFTYAEHGDHQLEAMMHYMSQQKGISSPAELALEDMSYPSDPMLMRSQTDESRSLLEYVRLYLDISGKLQTVLD